MKAIQIDETKQNIEEAIRSLKVVEKPIPKPKSGQVLIRIEAAPRNPQPLPAIPPTSSSYKASTASARCFPQCRDGKAPALSSKTGAEPSAGG
ncbi:hypothetical protein [Estrella lausannensis]|uniref:hypothetical protein n=1 Tax=Estrella lausannensis TaxID=483423 RepID=UPI00117B806B|nr:hypothetical protein [Estrella lausannensis]